MNWRALRQRRRLFLLLGRRGGGLARSHGAGADAGESNAAAMDCGVPAAEKPESANYESRIGESSLKNELAKADSRNSTTCFAGISNSRQACCGVVGMFSR